MPEVATSPVPLRVPDPALVAALQGALAPARVSVLAADRLTYARDLWPRGLLSIAAGAAPLQAPDVVAWPESTAEVQAVVRLCRERRVPLTPFGAGSGVCGGAVAARGVTLDLKRMRGVVIDGASASVTFEPGILGTHLEAQLNRRGFTLGHFPSSIMCSTAGGWLATRGAGQCSTKYGKIEDMVRSIEVVDGRGEALVLDSQEAGADVLQLLVGSEGTLGVITRATCALRPLPAARRMRGWSLPDVPSGCDAIRRLLQRGLRPAVVRLYDELDTLISSSRDPQAAGHADAGGFDRQPPRGGAVNDPFRVATGGEREAPSLDDWLEMLRPDAARARSGLVRLLVGTALGRPGVLNRMADRLSPKLSGGCLLILGFEGDAELCELEERVAADELTGTGGRDLGPGPGEHWLLHRYDVSFKMPRAFAAGAFVDTMEVATTWERLMPLYRAVREAASPHAFVMAHFSHAYEGGCSIYFTFAGRRSSDLPRGARSASKEARQRAHLQEDLERYDAMWKAALGAVVRSGATISHHHGVGALKAGFMNAEHGEGMALFAALKGALDPDGILNPGKLGLAAVAR